MRKIAYCNADGNLSATAVAGSPNGKELAEILEEGVVVEVLAWEMDVEEPMAAGIISRALQKSHELALRTTELSALATLKGQPAGHVCHRSGGGAYAAGLSCR